MRERSARPLPTPTRNDVELVFGLRAALAVMEARDKDIQRVLYTAQGKADAQPLMSFAQERRIAHAQVTEAELSRVTESPQHEGICLETKPRRWTAPAALGDLLMSKRGVAVAFDRVRNPYNIGAVLRSAAFFGVDAAVLGMPAPHPALSPQAVRVAEGGAEHLILTRTTDLADTLGRLRAQGITIVGAEDDGSASAIGFNFKRPCVLVLGHEREGLSARVRAQCDVMVAIPGVGHVHSLNVSIAASILITELQRDVLAAPRVTSSRR